MTVCYGWFLCYAERVDVSFLLARLHLSHLQARQPRFSHLDPPWLHGAIGRGDVDQLMQSNGYTEGTKYSDLQQQRPSAFSMSPHHGLPAHQVSFSFAKARAIWMTMCCPSCLAASRSILLSRCDLDFRVSSPEVWSATRSARLFLDRPSYLSLAPILFSESGRRLPY